MGQTTSDDFEGLRNVAQACFDASRAKGWHDDIEKVQQLADLAANNAEVFGNADVLALVRWATAKLETAVVAEKIALIHSEASEALEDVRNPNMDMSTAYYADKTATSGMRTKGDPYYEEGSKPIGVPTELADIVIRVFDLAGRLGIDIAAVIEEKMAYNATRPRRHGGKRA